MKVIIVGGGQVGAYIAQTLIKNKIDVKVIENRQNVFDKLTKDLPNEVIIQGDGTSHEMLMAAGITNCDIMVAVSGADETNLVVSTLAKFEYGVPKVIARVNNPKNEWMFDMQMGVDIKLNQANLVSRIIVENMDFVNFETLLSLATGDYSIIKIKVQPQSKAVNLAIKDLKLPARSLLVAINRKTEVILPKGDVVIAPEDDIIAFVHETEKPLVTSIFQ